MRAHRPERIAEMVREEIVQIVGYELDDPRVEMVTVTDVRVSGDLRDASVYVTITGTEREARLALAALREAAPRIRQQIALELSLRRVPHLHFVRDTEGERAERVGVLLYQLETERRAEQKSNDVEEEVPRSAGDEGRR
uniref:30S ribosome-binding factor RbfA n=1 Tax=Pyrinomonas sp. TaxID=2080306 RepID=UPI0033280405